MANTAATGEPRLKAPATFLESLSPTMRAALLDDVRVITAPAARLVYAASDRAVYCGIVREGLLRIFLATTDGRRLTVRYARAGSFIGAYGIIDQGTPLSVEAVTDCAVFDVDPTRLQQLVEADGRLGWLVVAEIGRSLRDAYAMLVANTLGSLVERVAAHLLELAVVAPGNRLVAPVTQQTLAESVGTAREAVGRVLRDLRAEGVVATRVGTIELLDPVRLAAVVGRWQAALRP